LISQRHIDEHSLNTAAVFSPNKTNSKTHAEANVEVGQMNLTAPKEMTLGREEIEKPKEKS
jgi:hypothetical protein